MKFEEVLPAMREGREAECNDAFRVRIRDGYLETRPSDGTWYRPELFSVERMLNADWQLAPESPLPLPLPKRFRAKMGGKPVSGAVADVSNNSFFLITHGFCAGASCCENQLTNIEYEPE